MIKWTDLHSSLQLDMITTNFWRGTTSAGRIKYADLYSALKTSIGNKNYSAVTTAGKLKWADLHSSLQVLLMTSFGYAEGTTGGAGGGTTTVTTKAGFKAAVLGNSAKIVKVVGSINIDYTEIGDNTTIYADLGSGAGVIGTHRIEGTNVIVRNLNITAPQISGTDEDGIGIAGGTYVWIDNCTLVDCTDGMIDCTSGADFITISRCKFSYTTDYVHALTNLIGGSDGAILTDGGKLHVTFAYNYWSENIKDRMPRVRFGRVHVLNNYHNPLGPLSDNGAIMTAAIDGEIFSEGNYIESGEDVYLHYSGQNGKIKALNDYIDPSVSGNLIATDTVFTPPYNYRPLTAAAAKTFAIANAGVH